MRALQNLHTKLNTLVVLAIISATITILNSTSLTSFNLYIWLAMVIILAITYQLHREILTDITTPLLWEAFYTENVIKACKKVTDLSQNDIDKNFNSHQNKHARSIVIVIALFILFAGKCAYNFFKHTPENITIYTVILDTALTLCVVIIAISFTKYICDNARNKNLPNIETEIAQKQAKYAHLFNN